MVMENPTETARESTRDASKAFAIFTAIMVLGMPFSLFWIVAWIGVEFVGLLCFIAYKFSGSR